MEATETYKLGPPKHVRFSDQGDNRIEKLSRMFTSLYPAVCSRCGKRFKVYCKECGHRAIYDTGNGGYECMECGTVSTRARCPATCNICDGQVREKEVSDSEQIRHSVNFLYTVMLAGYTAGDILMEITMLCRESLQQPLKSLLDGSNPTPTSAPASAPASDSDSDSDNDNDNDKKPSLSVYRALYETAEQVDGLQSVSLGDLMARLHDKAKVKRMENGSRSGSGSGSGR